MTTPTPADQQRERWSAAAAAYDKVIMPVTALYAADALRMAGFKPGLRVLDVAAGSGALSLQAVDQGAQVVATDFSEGMIEHLRGKIAAMGLEGIEATVMDGQALDLPDDSFDVAGSVFGLIFFPDRAKGFSELHRVLKPGGRAVVVSWGAPEPEDLLGFMFQVFKSAFPDAPLPPGTPPVLSLHDPVQFRAEMEKAGFRDVEIQSVTHPWTAATPEALWDPLAAATPVLAALFETAGLAGEAKMRQTALNILRSRFGDNPVGLQAQAFIGVGVK
jgi:SAM-dependent methyltransferase